MKNQDKLSLFLSSPVLLFSSQLCVALCDARIQGMILTSPVVASLDALIRYEVLLNRIVANSGESSDVCE